MDGYNGRGLVQGRLDNRFKQGFQQVHATPSGLLCLLLRAFTPVCYQTKGWPFSSALIPPVAWIQSLSTITWQVQQAQAPPQSASIPGMPLSTATCIRDWPASISTTCSVPLCSINVIRPIRPSPELFRGITVSWPDYGDRKSTRLNSSHVKISYAVFCLKKKN